jgi:adenylyltransferase/sulfurtransferase
MLDLARYHGHLSLPEVGLAGQQRLAASSVLCIGAGGLGSPALLYLAAAGVGRIGLLDADEVDVSNLQRQVLYRTTDVGESKVEAARRTLAALNPDIELVAHHERLNGENAERLLAPYDVILDGTDNFPTRYLINDTCVKLGKPDVWASVFRFEGQLAVFDATRGPCYRCLFPEVPPEEEIPSCAEAGVLGVLPGILGVSQALEVIKVLLGIGRPLIGRLLTFDALAMAWQELAFEKDPDCRACSGQQAVPAQALPLVQVEEPVALEPVELRARLQTDGSLVVLDCRSPLEWDICRLPGSVMIPWRELGRRVEELDRDRPLVVVCHRGPRSQHVAAYLQQAGFSDVGWLEGGLHAWATTVDPSMTRY